jgi:hypothetical protein
MCLIFLANDFELRSYCAVILLFTSNFKIFSCDECKELFSRCKNRNRHLARHVVIKPQQW